MLKLEILEPRCLLSLIITDSFAPDNDNSIDFGTNAMGNSSDLHQVILHNDGDTDINITDWTLADSGDFQTANLSYFSLGTRNFPDNDSDDVLLEPGETRNIHLRFIPVAFKEDSLLSVAQRAAFADKLTIKYVTNGNQNISPDVNLTGTVTGADLLVTESSGVINDDILNMGSYLIDPATEPRLDTFTLSNNGDQDLNINDIVFADTAGRFSLSTDAPDLPETLSAGASTTLTVEFQTNLNDQPGDYSDTITIYSTDLIEPIYTLNVTVDAVKPLLAVYESAGQNNDDIIEFGRHPINHDQPIIEIVNLVNDGTANVTVTSLDFANLDDTDFAIASAFLIDGAGNSTEVTDFSNVVIEPFNLNATQFQLHMEFLASSEDFFKDTFTITTDIGTNVLSLNGFADPGSIDMLSSLTLDPVIVDHNTTSFVSSDTFAIRNNGDIDITLTSVTVLGGNYTINAPDIAPAPVTTLILNQVLSPSQLVQIEIDFDATGLPPDLYPGSIIINSSTIIEPTMTLATSVGSPEIELLTTNAPFDANDAFVNIGDTAVIPITISNQFGTSDLIINDFESDDSQFSLDLDGSLIIAPGQTDQVDLIYLPSRLGQVQTQMTLINNDLDEFGSTIITISGQSKGLPLAIQPNSTHTFHDADGDMVRIIVSNSGALLYLEGGKQDNADVALLELINISDKAKLRVINSTGQTNFGSIHALIDGPTDTGNVDSIFAPRVNLTNEIVIDGFLNKLTLNNINADSSITLGQPSSRPMTINAQQIDDNVSFDLNSSYLRTFNAQAYVGGQLTAGDIGLVNISQGNLGAHLTAVGKINRIKVKNNITGDIRALYDINSIISKNGGIGNSPAQQNNYIIAGDSSLKQFAQNIGGIRTITAKTHISATILSRDDIRSLNVKNGSFTSTVRATNINTILAGNMTGALISTDEKLGSVKVQTDIIDSHLLAGFDIGMSTDLLDFTNDDLRQGHLSRVWFGGELKNSYITSGAMTNNIYLNLYNQIPGNAEYSVGSARIARVQGKNISASNNNIEFGLYASGTISTNLDPQSDFVIIPNI